VDGGAEEGQGQGQGHQMDLDPPSQDAKTLFVGGLNPAITRYSGEWGGVCVYVRVYVLKAIRTLAYLFFNVL
jgi:hypothetical protein